MFLPSATSVLWFSKVTEGEPARALLWVFPRLHRELNRPGAGPPWPQAKAVQPRRQALYLREVAESPGSGRLPPLWTVWSCERRTPAAAGGGGAGAGPAAHRLHRDRPHGPALPCGPAAPGTSTHTGFQSGWRDRVTDSAFPAGGPRSRADQDPSARALPANAPSLRAAPDSGPGGVPASLSPFRESAVGSRASL